MARRPREPSGQADLFAGLANPGSGLLKPSGEAPEDGQSRGAADPREEETGGTPPGVKPGGLSASPATLPEDPELARVMARIEAAVEAMRARGVEVAPRNWGVGMQGGKWVLDGRCCCALGALMVHEGVRVSRVPRDPGGHVVSSVRADVAKALGVGFGEVDALIAGFDGHATAPSGKFAAWERAGVSLRQKLSP